MAIICPDTRATSYRTQHTKTTIGVDCIDIGAGRLSYFHNVGHYELTGEDYAGVFRKLAGQRCGGRRAAALCRNSSGVAGHRYAGAALTDASVALLRRHLRRRPEQNPIRRYRADFPQHMDWLMAHPDRFHDYAFGVFRQLGANFQLLRPSTRLVAAELPRRFDRGTGRARRFPPAAKTMQFKVARIASRRRFDPCDAMFETLERDYEAVMSRLDADVRLTRRGGSYGLASFVSCSANHDGHGLPRAGNAWSQRKRGIATPGTSAISLVAGAGARHGRNGAACRRRMERQAPLELDQHDIWYRMRFAGGGDEVLRFEGLATIADVWLNGEHLLRSDNMFLPQRGGGRTQRSE